MIAQTVADLEDNLKNTEAALKEVTDERNRIASQLDAKALELADLRGLYKRYQEDRDDAVEIAVALETQFQNFATQMGHVAQGMAELCDRMRAAKSRRKAERQEQTDSGSNPLTKLADILEERAR